MAVLVVGGAGYIGSHTAHALKRRGHEVIIYDNLVAGHEALARGFELIVGDVADTAKLQNTTSRSRTNSEDANLTNFFGLEKVLPSVFNVLTGHGEAIVLVKPQFEVGKGQVGKGGVVRDNADHRTVIARVARFAVLHGWHVRGVTASPLKGPKGNREFFLLLTKTGRTLADLDALITKTTAVEEPQT